MNAESPSLTRFHWAAAVCAATAMLGGVYVWRFPGQLFLGDGWIFLQYARNLAAGHGWSFNPGETSFGATSPAWVAMLAPLFLLGSRDVVVWPQLLGLICFAAGAG